MMDNRTIDLTAQGDDALAKAISIMWPSAPGGKVTHYVDEIGKREVEYYGNPTTHHSLKWVLDPKGTQTLILCWARERDSKDLPFEMDMEDAIAFCKIWLKRARVGNQPDIDGELGLGFRLFTEDWGHVCGRSYGVFGLQPVWAMYGK